MAIAIMFGGVALGMGSAVMSVIAGHPPVTTVLVYMTAGLVGSLMVAAASLRQTSEFSN